MYVNTFKGGVFMLLEDILEEFIYDCRIRNLSERTIKGYKNNNLKFIKFLESEFSINKVFKVNSKHIKMYFSLLKKQGLTEVYINSILKCLRVFFRYCIHEEYIENNPCLKVSWCKEKKTIIKTFSDEEVTNILNVFTFSNYLNTRNKTILACFLDTGIRNQELCDIRNDDIKERYIIIHGKGNKERYVPITPLLKKYMIKYERMKEIYFKDKFNIDEYYFLSRTGKKLTVEANENILRKAGKKAKIRDEIRCSPHTCRHYYAQTQLRNGLDVYSLSRLLGHENISITKRYLQSLKDEDIVEMSIKTSPLMNLK